MKLKKKKNTEIRKYEKNKNSTFFSVDFWNMEKFLVWVLFKGGVYRGRTFYEIHRMRIGN